MERTLLKKSVVLLSFFAVLPVFAQQIEIDRITQMPYLPQPYAMRDWQKVALAYDSLVFDRNATGQYLPLIWIIENTVNYPEHTSFGLHSAVGTKYPENAEAINILPAVIGATLNGIDKSIQYGYNWVLACEEFFNRRPEENIYLNGAVASSGSDWWYDTMPNVFFYQLYDLYPGTGSFSSQIETVADRFLQSVAVMGGKTTPWKIPNMNYRAFRFSSMQPNATGVKQPEAAGAIAWLLYHAFNVTGKEKYRIGAEWCMEFLSSWPTNPAYELQLPYGVYIAAKMNAELQTGYDVAKLLNWCFTPEGNVRGWGATLGNWGGYDCAGLIGEAAGEGYAFVMNGFEQAGALVPMVRYDDRFARTIGKWVLNLANASRLFYTAYLPDENQDGEAWAKVYDPRSSIAHEAMREFDLNSAASPFATGDFARSGWAATNYALYGASHVGIMGGIIDTTDVSMILCLDTRRTDYFQSDGYATYLCYNPYPEEKTITFDAGAENSDLWDMVSNTYLAQGVSGSVQLSIPATEAILVVILPGGAETEYREQKMLVNGIVVDYNARKYIGNYSPRIKSLDADRYVLLKEEQVNLYCAAEDPDGDPLTYIWLSDSGTISGSGSMIAWQAPQTGDLYHLVSIADDENGGLDTAMISIEVLDNAKPVITALRALREEIDLLDSTTVTCAAYDPDGDSLQYVWSGEAGSIVGEGPEIRWQAPDSAGIFRIFCQVVDARNAAVEDTVYLTVGHLVAFYPFNASAEDLSGFGNNGTVNGAIPVDDRFGNPDAAYYFDGVNDAVIIPWAQVLNFRNAITINFWMSVGEFFTREAHPISHGSWENRWKISITNKRIRWTVKTDTLANNGIKDLDSSIELVLDSLYNVTTVYEAGRCEIYINGQPDKLDSWRGKILQTPIDLTIGQLLPNNSAYNFKGVLDDIRIYNRALSADEIKTLYDQTTDISGKTGASPSEFALLPNYPNPFNNHTRIIFTLGVRDRVFIDIYNIRGQHIARLLDGSRSAGRHSIIWDGSDKQGIAASSGLYICRMKTEKFSQARKLILLR